MFAPNEQITRQQFCRILYNVAKYLNPSLIRNPSITVGFSDIGTVAPWAKAVVAYCINSGIIKGIDGKIVPNGNITREQAIVMLVRFFEM